MKPRFFLVALQVKIAQLAPAQGRQPAAYGRSNHPGAHPIHVVKPHPHVQAIDLAKVTAKHLAIIHGPSPRLTTPRIEQGKEARCFIHPKRKSPATPTSKQPLAPRWGQDMNSLPHPPPTTKARSSNTQRRTQILLTNCPTEKRDARAKTLPTMPPTTAVNPIQARADPIRNQPPRLDPATRNETAREIPKKEFDGPRTPSTASRGRSGARPQIGRRARRRSDLGPGKRMRGRRRRGERRHQPVGETETPRDLSPSPPRGE